MYNRYRHTLTLIIIALISLNAAAQKRTYSPYSRYGIGELEDGGFGRNAAMGRTGIALQSPNHLNNINPASYAGMDSLGRAMETYTSVTTVYPRSMFSAEAYFRLGEIYQDRLDSLQVAKQQFDQVPQQYAGSPFAEEAISKSAAISKLLRLRESLQSGGEGDQPAVQFDLAEVELFQFKNYTKALEGYRKILDEYPDVDLAPKAAYAIGYVYEVHLGDIDRAREAYEYVLNRYPDTQQAEYARQVLERLAAERQP